MLRLRTSLHAFVQQACFWVRILLRLTKKVTLSSLLPLVLKWFPENKNYCDFVTFRRNFISNRPSSEVSTTLPRHVYKVVQKGTLVLMKVFQKN